MEHLSLKYGAIGLLVVSTLSLSPCGVAATAGVQAALAWQLPINSCKQPKPPRRRKQVVDSSGISREEWDVDHYTLRRYTRKKQRWQKCVHDYKMDLMDSFMTLKNSARHGLSKNQARIILGKMKEIQTVMESPEGEQPPTGDPIE